MRTRGMAAARRGRSVAGVLVWVLVAVALSGCVEDSDEVPEVPESTNTVVRDPTDFSYLENGTGSDDGYHLHDYWGNAEVLTLMDTSAFLTVTAFQDLNRWQFRPESGNVVPLGTANVTVFFEWDENPGTTYGEIKLYLKTQLDNQSVEYATLENGGSLTIPSTNDHNDLPHQTLSAWSFDFFITMDPQLGFLRFNNEVRMSVQVERGLEIPLFPGHPDHWKNATTIQLVDESFGQFYHMDHAPAPNSICSQCLPVHSPADQLLVPLDASHVTATVTFDAVTPTALRFGYHGGESRDFTIIEPDAIEGTVREYTIPVRDGMADGPYATQSLWEFQLFTEQTADNGIYGGSYQIEVWVHKGTD